MKKLLLLFFPLTLFGATQEMRIDTLTHKVVKPPFSSSALFDWDFSDGTTNITGGGGGGTPGGSNQQLQFNNAFTMGGVPYATYDGTTVTFRTGARFTLADPTDATKRVQISLVNPTGTLKTLTLSDDAVGAIPSSVTTNMFMTNINTLGVSVKAQPLFSMIGGNLLLSQTSMATNKLIGRGTAGTGAMEEITLGTNLTLSGTTLNAAGGAGTPGGSTAQLQWNNAGVFAGISSLTADVSSNVFATSTRFFISDVVDPTKQLRFNLSNVGSGSVLQVTSPSVNSVLVGPDAGASNNFLTGITSAGVITKAQPNFNNFTGSISMLQNKLLIGKELFQDGTNGIDPPTIGGGVRGDLTKPFLTIAAALAAASSGDVVYAGPGTTSVAATPLVVPAGVTLTGAGVDTTSITGTTGLTRAVVEPGTGSAISNMTIQNTASSGVPFGVGSGSSAFTSAFVSGVKIIGVSNGVYINKAGTTGLHMENVIVQTQGDCFYSNIVGALSELRNCDLTSDGTGVTDSRGFNIDSGVVRSFQGTITVGGGSGSNICGYAKGANSTLELHDSRVSTTASGTTNTDVAQATSATVGVNNVYRPDAGPLITTGTVSQLSRYAVRDNNLSDYPNLGVGTWGDIIIRNATGWTKLGAGTDGFVLTTHSTTADPTWAAGGAGGTVSDTAFASSWNGVVSVAPSQNAVYDWGHTFDTDDDGKVNVLDMGAGLVKTDAGGVVSAATAGTDYENALIFTSPLSRTANTVSLLVNVDHAFTQTQSITVNNATTNGITTLLNVEHDTSGTATTGLGAGIQFRGETDSGAGARLGDIQMAWSDAGAGSLTSYIDFLNSNNLSVTSKMRLHGSGGLSLGNTTDPTAGIFAANTGYRVGTAASTSGKILKSDGTKFTASTETYAVPGTTGNVLTSDGTNWLSTAPSVTDTNTVTLTNKRVTPRVSFITSNAAWTPSADTDDVYEIRAQAAAVTTISNPAGTPTNNQSLIIRFKDDGTPRALTWSGTQYEAGPNQTLPTTTVAGQTDWAGFKWNSATSKWTMLANSQTSAAAGGVTSVTGTSPIIVTPTTGATVVSLDNTVDLNLLNAQTVGSNDANNNSNTTLLTLQHNTSGTPSVGMGNRLSFKLESSTTNNRNAGAIDAVWSDPADATRTAYLDFSVSNNGGFNDVMRLFGDGGLSLNSHASPGAGYFNANTGYKIANTDIKDATLTWTNKRNTPRVTAIASNATWSPNADTDDVYQINGQSVTVTAISNPSGTPVNNQSLIIRFTDNGVAKAMTWSGSQWEAGPNQTLPTATIGGQTDWCGFRWNSATSKWTMLANSQTAAATGTVTSVGLAGTANQITITGTSPITTSGSWTASIPASAQISMAKNTLLTTNGFVKTSGSDGTLGIDTATYLTSSSISNTAYGAGWNGDTTVAPSKNAVYDELHLIDTADDGTIVSAGIGFRIGGAAASGKLLVGNGTNFVASTPTYPNAASPTSGKIIKSDGTNWTASTETYAAPGQAYNVMTSDGTNWTSTTPAFVMIYTKSVSLLTAGAPADIATLTIPAGITRWKFVGSTGPTSMCGMITETQAGTPVAGTCALYTAAAAGGTNMIAASAPNNGAPGFGAWFPATNAMQFGVNTLYIRQTANSANAATVSFYIVIEQFP